MEFVLGAAVSAMTRYIPGWKLLPVETVNVFAPVPMAMLEALVSVVELRFIATAVALASVTKVGSAARSASALLAKFAGSFVDGGLGRAVIMVSFWVKKKPPRLLRAA